MACPNDDEETAPRAETKRAVRTTIVGGQPPGNQRALPPIPVGIEELLAMATADPRFGKALLANRRAAIAASGVSLTPTETGILGAIDGPALRHMIDKVAGVLPDQERRAFMTRSAAALLVLAGGAAPLGGCGDDDAKDNERHKQKPPSPKPSDAAAKRAGDASDPKPPPDAPRPTPEPAGIRPDRPPPPTRGIRPDRPRPGPTRGIRPDRTIPKPAKGS